MSGPSDKALEAGERAYVRIMPSPLDPPDSIAPVVHEVYPVIRAEVIAEIVAALRAAHEQTAPGFRHKTIAEVADFIEREFS